jgi:hypothetical protein
MSYQTRQNVKKGKVSPKEAYDKLYPLIGKQFVHLVPTMRWLKGLVEGRKIVQKTNNKQDKKLDFNKKKYNK